MENNLLTPEYIVEQIPILTKEELIKLIWEYGFQEFDSGAVTDD